LLVMNLKDDDLRACLYGVNIESVCQFSSELFGNLNSL
jgi:hypothetical protein